MAAKREPSIPSFSKFGACHLLLSEGIDQSHAARGELPDIY